MKAWVNYANCIIFRLLPETKCFALKCMMLRFAGARIGQNVRICSSAMIIGTGDLIIGDNVWIGHQVFISVTSKIVIEDCVDIAPLVYIGTGTHQIDLEGVRMAGKGISGDITIGKGVWLCARSCIFPFVSIGEKSIVAAGAIVTKSVGERTMVGGIPAKIIKQL